MSAVGDEWILAGTLDKKKPREAAGASIPWEKESLTKIFSTEPALGRLNESSGFCRRQWGNLKGLLLVCPFRSLCDVLKTSVQYCQGSRACFFPIVMTFL